MDLILTGRPVDAWEAERMGLVNRVVPVGQARVEAEALARSLAELPQDCLRNDRLSALEQEGLTEAEAMAVELAARPGVAGAGALDGAARFASGEGRHGAVLDAGRVVQADRDQRRRAVPACRPPSRSRSRPAQLAVRPSGRPPTPGC